MEEEPMENQNNTLYYIIGAVVLVAVIGAGYLLRPKPATTPAGQAPTGGKTAQPTPALGPIAKLGCDMQYYNPVIGFPKYYLSVDGSDVPGATKVDCKFSVVQDNKIVATETVTTSQLTAKSERNGNVFKCTTPGLDLKPNVPTRVDIALKDDKDATATCGAVFLLPR